VWGISHELTTLLETHLEQAKEEARREQAAVPLCETLKDSNETEHEHAEREPEVRAETFEQKVGRDLEQDVGRKEDDEGVVVLESRQLQVRLQPEDGGVRDVHAARRLS
jgi:hypothetical protein